MKRIAVFLVLMLLLVTAANSVMAQGLDTDGDGVPARSDNCPRQAGPAANNGCPFQADVFVIEVQPTVPPPPPPVDTDGDGLSDPNDQCPTVHGLADNGGCPLPPPPPPPNNPSSNPSSGDPDADGDGTPDSGDECPTVSGPRENRGCPPSNPPTTDNPPANNPPNNPSGDVPPSVPPFTPPQLPTHECFVTSANGNNINVRQAPDMTAAVIGSLLPGVVYPAHGYVMNGAEVWYVLTGYVGTTGEFGYSAGSVLLSSDICAQIADPGNPGSVGIPTRDIATDFDSPDGGSTILCHMSVGYDSPTWSGNPEIPSVTYAAFWFEWMPGEPLPAGTRAWGVIMVEDFITLQDSENVIAIAPSQALFEEAQNSAYGGAYNWPTLEGGIQSGGESLYRLTDDNNPGACGPIVGIGGLTTSEGELNPPEPNGGAIDRVPSDIFLAIDAENETRKEDPAWWENAMPLICGGGDFIILTETDADGDEVVTDAQCEDSID